MKKRRNVFSEIIILLKEGTIPRNFSFGGKTIMDANRNKKYFSQKPHTVITVIAVALIALGFCFLILLNGMLDPLSIAMMFVGAILFLFVNLQVKDSELGESAKEVLAKFTKEFEEEFIYRDTRKLHQAELQGFQHKDPVYESSYIAEGEGLLTRRGSDGKIRTSMYQCVGILMETDYICIGTQQFSLIGGAATQPTMMRVEYGELSHVALGEAIPKMHLTTMEVYGEDGTCLMKFQMRADAQTDDLVADINAKIKKCREE